MRRWVKTSLVIGGAVVLSTVAIQASDLTRGVSGNLLGLAHDATSVCGPGAVEINTGSATLCFDQYEASPAPGCPVANITSGIDTQNDLNDTTCAPVSVPNVLPWSYVTVTQAAQLCARAGKRLPTNKEWYMAALQLADSSGCILNGSAPGPTGSGQCATPLGIHDLVGNVWEWIDGQVNNGSLEGRSVPDSGYVASVDTEGVVVSTSQNPQTDYGADYAKTDSNGVFGIIRGGYYGSQSDGGVFAQNLAVPLELKTPGVGFRCVKTAG